MNDEEIMGLIAKAEAAFGALSPEQQAEHRRAQAISFVYGNLRLAGRDITELQVADAYDELHRAPAPDVSSSTS